MAGKDFDPGLSYQQAIYKLIDALQEYKGEEVPKTEGTGEHALHYAVRCVEAHCPKNGIGHKPLPPAAHAHWLDLLAFSRTHDHQKVAWWNNHCANYATRFRARGFGDWDRTERYAMDPQPDCAMTSAGRLLRWALEEKHDGEVEPNLDRKISMQ